MLLFIYVCVSTGIYLGMELLGDMFCIYFALSDPNKQFSKVLVSIYTLARVLFFQCDIFFHVILVFSSFAFNIMIYVNISYLPFCFLFPFALLFLFWG